MEKIIYVDMDNVLVNFQSGLDLIEENVRKEYADDGTGKPCYDEIPGIFGKMLPQNGAIEAMHKLKEAGFDMYILSTAPWKNPSAWSDKLLWVQKYLGDVFFKRIILSHHKNLCHGDYLIDDRDKNGASEFNGELIRFNTDVPSEQEWSRIVKYLFEKKTKYNHP